MFFPDRLKSIRSGDRVLEVGPGCTPHPRSDVLLERNFDPDEALVQRGSVPATPLLKPVVYFEGGRFPFGDNSFDYVICSHVLEHVEDVPAFLAELMRVAPSGYLEFPTAYYEYLYNFRVHRNLLHFDGRELFWMLKSAVPLDTFQPLQSFFYRALGAGYDDLIVSLKPHFAEGFEWHRPLIHRIATHLAEVCPTPEDFRFPTPPSKIPQPGSELVRELGRRVRQRLRW